MGLYQLYMIVQRVLYWKRKKDIGMYTYVSKMKLIIQNLIDTAVQWTWIDGLLSVPIRT